MQRKKGKRSFSFTYAHTQPQNMLKHSYGTVHSYTANTSITSTSLISISLSFVVHPYSNFKISFNKFLVL